MTYTYQAEINPKSLRDRIMFTIFKGMLNGFPAVGLDEFIPLHSQQIHILASGGYIKHEGDGKWSLTKIGQAALESRYKKMPTNAGFTLNEVQ